MLKSRTAESEDNCTSEIYDILIIFEIIKMSFEELQK